MLATQDDCDFEVPDEVLRTRVERLIEMGRGISLMQLMFAKEAAEFAATEEYEEWGATTPIDWIRIHCHMTGPQAANYVAAGEHFDELPQTTLAMAEGKVGFGHMVVIARTTDALAASPTARDSAKAVERLACDCSVTRILLDSDSLVIDVGRAKRVISAAQRKALNARDQHCAWPGCDRPASWTSGHHLVHWIHGGTSDLPNLALLCYRHHWMVHEGGWQLVRGDGGRMVTIPPTVTVGPSPRGPD
jgi:Domain of unknown function (DUF222)/HNH endonuclease